MQVTVCIATRDREEGLLALLQSIGRTRRTPDCQLRVVIVNNSSTPLGHDTSELEAAVQAPVTLHAELRQGIPQARNRGVSVAMPTDFVVFVDDDELVSESWLEHLLSVQRATGADVVTGPVVATYPQAAPVWAAASGVYERPRRPTGTLMDTAATGNTLVAGAVFDQMDPWFDDRLAVTGGSDSEFFGRVHRAGFRMVWADEAVVTEEVSAQRLSLRWVLKRNYRIGIVMSRNLQAHDPRHRGKRAIKHGAIAIGALVRSLFSLPTARATAVARAALAARSVGRVAGLVGLEYREYA